MSVGDKEKILEKHFNNEIDSKSLRKFKQKTPAGNYVSGWICKSPGKYLSSMVLTEIQVGESKTIKCDRFIRGMPKQHYYDSEKWSLYHDPVFTNYYCYEKIDGTCLMFYALYDEEDNLIEIIPRTRGMAVADKNIVEMLKFVDLAQVIEFYYYPHNFEHVLMFELYGMLNRHEISYYDTYIDMKLIGCTVEKEVLKQKDVLAIALRHYFAIPDLLFELCYYDGEWKIWAHKSRLCPYYIKKEVIEKDTYESLHECIEALTNYLEQINEEYKFVNNHIATEGVVINGISKHENQRYVKIKPTSILELAKLGNGIPRHAIRKEVYKYFDEYGLDVKDIYNKDKTHYLSFIREKLLEEFPEHHVMSSKTHKKIDTIFFDIWESKTPDVSLQNLSEELVNKYEGKTINEIMSLFAKENPSLKNRAGEMYQILKYKVKEE